MQDRNNPDARFVKEHYEAMIIYSAFLIRNADGNLEHPDRDKCNAEFTHFVKMHDETIEKMKADGKSMKQCFGF